MANKKVTKVTTKKQTSVVVKKNDKKIVWIGSQSLMAAAKDPKEAKERQLIQMTAEVLGVSPFGVNILGSVPYVNKLGLGQKSNQYGNGADRFIYNWVQRALNDTDKAICECKIVRNGKDATDWVTGECSPKTTKMSTLMGYQNHMAQTRAKNRAILEAYGVRIHEDMITNIGKMVMSQDITPVQARALASHAGRVSSSSIEEIEQDKSAKTEVISADIMPHAPTVVGPDGDKVHVCAKCSEIITEQEANYSMKLYRKPLCRDHQEKARLLLAGKKKSK